MDLMVQVLLLMAGAFYLGSRYGQHSANKEFDKFIKLLEKTAKKPDPFFTRD